MSVLIISIYLGLGAEPVEVESPRHSREVDRRIVARMPALLGALGIPPLYDLVRNR